MFYNYLIRPKLDIVVPWATRLMSYFGVRNALSYNVIIIYLWLYVLFKDNLLIVFGNDIKNTGSNLTGVVLFLENKTCAHMCDSFSSKEYKIKIREYWMVMAKKTTLFSCKRELSLKNIKHEFLFPFTADPSDPKFVVKANSFRGLSYYLLTVRMNVSNSWSEMQMILETTNPPYGGICTVTKVAKSGKICDLTRITIRRKPY